MISALSSTLHSRRFNLNAQKMTKSDCGFQEKENISTTQHLIKSNNYWSNKYLKNGPIVAGIDNGTQSTKVICYDVLQKKVVDVGQSKHDLIVENDGTREQKASWWVKALKDSFSQINPEVRSKISAIGVSGQQHGFVPVDRNGEVLYNVKLWCDTSTIEECDEITQKYGGKDKLLNDGCNLILPGYTAGKILWLKKHKPEIYQKLAKILLPHDYLNYILTGRYSMEYGDASGTALMNIRKRKWSTEILHAIDEKNDISQLLPNLIKSDELAGTVTKEAAKYFGIPEGIMVSSGGGDNMICAIGTGTVSNGALTASLGTSATLFGSSDTPIIDPEGNLAAFCSSTNNWLPLLCTMNCTVASELTRSLFEMNIDEINKISSQAPIGSEGVLMIPFFNGERTPNYPRGKGCVVGFTPENMTKSNICRSAMESAIFGLKLGLDSFIKQGFEAKEIRLVGGGSKSKLWRQIIADVCNLPIVVPDVNEAAALGGALQAYWALLNAHGENVPIEKITGEHIQITESTKCKPIPQNVQKYKHSYAKYLEYVKNFKPLFSA
ncbi:xylulokinase [Tritrichomonas foetus]|uniref:glycerol kinase n=1 Tax=Tritrichomonas foetus TaxID=1144522 RepID=A0A1J4JA44_9EUKA|nr:xylulokinase [Tritrichomonas foetus]|eukprot:OHS96032.1 xylulokinase [Tritrichomonas foetus]